MARPVITQGREVPAPLQDTNKAAASWPAWIKAHDAEIRARLQEGEEDSLANLLMFGTSFTDQPRLTPAYMREVEQKTKTAGGSTEDGAQEVLKVVRKRADDLATQVASPHANERMLWMRDIITRKGIAPADHQAVSRFLLVNFARVRREYDAFAEQMRSMRQTADAEKAFEERSRMFQARGIALDTTLLPNFALEQALRELKSKGILHAKSVHHVGVVGPGLDFVDKG